MISMMFISIILFILSLCLLAVTIGSTISNYRDYKIMQNQYKRNEEGKKEKITRPLYFHEEVSGIVVPANVANKIVGWIEEESW